MLIVRPIGVHLGKYSNLDFYKKVDIHFRDISASQLAVDEVVAAVRANIMCQGPGPQVGSKRDSL